MEPIDPRSAGGRLAGFAVLDVRGPAAFARGHLAGSGHLPRAELRARRTELPPREAPILVVAEDGGEAAAAAAEVETLGYSAVAWLDAPLEALAGGTADLGPAARLWRPAAFLEQALPAVLAALGDRPEPPRALDLACGAGRDAVFLAGRGFAVEGWDHAPEALEQARALADRNGVAIHTEVRDLERPGLPPPDRPFDLVTCFRFLHRPLFAWMERALAPGGCLVCETYRRGQERFGRPIRAQFLLASGELARAFPGLEVLRYEEPDPPGGPVTARLLARKPTGA